MVQNSHRQTLHGQVVSSTLDTLFVYGTLMRTTDGAIHPLLVGRAEFLGAGSIAGKLYRVLEYPGAIMTEDEHSRVFGEVYRLLDAESLLAKLDEYEECTPNFPAPHEYLRTQLPVSMTAGQILIAWVYLYNLATTQLQLISSSDYRNDLSKPL